MNPVLKATVQTIGLASLMALLLGLTVFYFLPFVESTIDAVSIPWYTVQDALE